METSRAGKGEMGEGETYRSYRESSADESEAQSRGATRPGTHIREWRHRVPLWGALATPLPHHLSLELRLSSCGGFSMAT